jgi:hypothetical protein
MDLDKKTNKQTIKEQSLISRFITIIGFYEVEEEGRSLMDHDDRW